MISEMIQMSNSMKDQLDKFYLSSLLFREYSDHKNAKISLDRAIRVFDFPEPIIIHRKKGFSFKKLGNIDEARKHFMLASGTGDPISQYELAKLCKEDRLQYKTLLETSAPHLIQAEVALYRLQLNMQLYEEAYCLLSDILSTMEGLEIEGVPRISVESFSQDGYSQNRVVVNELSGKLSIIRLPRLPELLYQSAISLHDQEEQIHLYHLGAIRGHAKSIIALAKYNKYKIDSSIKEVIRLGKNGDSSATEKLISLLRDGDVFVLTELIGQAAFIESSYYLKIVEAAASYNHVALCMLGYMYGEAVGVKKNSEECSAIITQMTTTMEGLATRGDIMAQFCMGWIYEWERKDYTLSVKWYSKAALAGNVLALYRLGKVYIHGVYDYIFDSERDSDQGYTCYLEAADLGYAPAQISLGYLALHNENYTQAMEWFEKSIVQGYTEPRNRIEQLYKEGSEIERKLVSKLLQNLLDDNKVSIDTKEWVHTLLQHNASRKQIEQKGMRQGQEREETTENGSVQREAQYKQDERFKAEGFEEAERQKTSYDKKVLCITGVVYDNPQEVVQIQLKNMLMQTEKKATFMECTKSPLLSAEKSQLPSLRAMTFLKDAIVDEKLMAQAQFFAQEGVMFNTVREAVQNQRAYITSGEGEPDFSETETGERPFGIWEKLALSSLWQPSLEALAHDLLHSFHEESSYFF